MANLSNKAWIFIVAIFLVLGLIVGYSLGKAVGFGEAEDVFKAEINKAKEDLSKIQRELLDLQSKNE